MKVKKEYLVLALVIAGLSLYLFLRNTDKMNYLVPDLADIPKQDITRIEIAGPGDTHLLTKNGGGWTIGPREYPADADKVEKMLESIAGLTLTALVSETKNYDRYDLHANRKITVKAWAGDVLKRVFDLGKATSTFRHTFVKISEDERVFHAQDNIRNRFEQTLDDLRDKIVLSLNRDTIGEIQFDDHQAASRKSIRLTRKQTAASSAEKKPETGDTTAATPPSSHWEKSDGDGSGGVRVDDTKMSGLLDSLSNLRCEKYIQDGDKSAYTDPIYTLSLKGAETYTLSIFKKRAEDAESYPALSSQNDYVFILGGWEVGGLLDKLDAKPEEPQKEAVEAEEKKG